MDAYQIVFCTTPDLETARKITRHLIEENLAACCNLLPAVESIYRWENMIEQNQEVLIMIKSTVAHYKAIERAILTLHPYDIPEIIATPINSGSVPYLDWIKTTLKGVDSDGT